MKYRPGTLLHHIVSGREYAILKMPDDVILEHNGELAYAYQNINNRVAAGPVFVRAAHEIEDQDRFRLLPSSYGDVYGGETGYWG